MFAVRHFCRNVYRQAAREKLPQKKTFNTIISSGNVFLKSATVNSRYFSTSQCCADSIKVESVKNIDKGISLRFSTNDEHQFNYVWLRDHCNCSGCYNEHTYQRTYDTHEIALDIQPKQITHQNKQVRITWPDNHVTTFDASWLLENHYEQSAYPFVLNPKERVYWGSELKDNMVEGIDYEKVISNDESLYQLLKNISVYGLGFVSNTPTTLEDLKRVAQRIAPLRPTHYGEAWELKNVGKIEDYEHLDNSYSNVSLPGHTDGTYFNDSPGLQFFHCHNHDGHGGDSLLVDGIHAAQQLRHSDPASFEFLSSTIVPATYYEPTYYTRCFAPLIKIDPVSKEIYHVRINDLDRDILNCLSYEDVQKFYEANHKFTTILRNKANELWLKLTPGNLMILHNWRVLHGRSEFTGSRTLGGAYINHDDFLSKMRVLRQQFQ